MRSISVCIATLNAQKVLDECLTSLINQEYPRDKIEIIASDGGSTDNTIKILEHYGSKIYTNPLKTAEAGKAVSIKHAKNELILLLDSDNFLPDKNWLKKMTEPFDDQDIVAAEPIRYTYRKNGGYIERYSALFGMNDPICLFLGNYDRQNYYTNDWTKIEHTEYQKDGYLKVILDMRGLPTIGANGTIFKKSFLDQSDIGDYLFDIDILANEIYKNKQVTIAKVDVGIIHTFCEASYKKFIRKSKRRIIDYLMYKRMGLRKYNWDNKLLSSTNKYNFFKFLIYSSLIVPTLVQAIRGYTRKKDPAWFFHPLACFTILVINTYYVLISKVRYIKMDRQKWSQ